MWTWLSDSEYETTGLTTGSNSGLDMSAASHALSAVAAVTIAKTENESEVTLQLAVMVSRNHDVAFMKSLARLH